MADQSDPQQVVEAIASESIEKVSEAVKVATDEKKEEVTEKVAETKNFVASFVKHGLSKAEDLVHVAKDFVDKNGVKIEEKMGKVSDSWASLVKGGSSGEAPLPVSDKSSESSTAVADAGGIIGTRDIPQSAEKQPLLGAAQPQTSWKNCCGLLDCLTSSA